MRAWVIYGYDGYKGLSLEEFDKPEPGPGEARLRVEAFALNWGDMDLMRDRYSFSFREFPALVGIEAAGIVDAVGPDVEGIDIGRRYCSLPYFYYNRGMSTEYAIIDARYITPAPDGMSAVESSSIWMQYMTAYFPIVEISRAKPGTCILATAATSTAGSSALEIGKQQGATMIGTTRFAYNEAYLRKMGASHVFVDDGSDLAEYLCSITGGTGIDAAFDPVGGGMISRYSPALAKESRIFFYGSLDGNFPDLPMVDMFQANAVFHPYSLCNYVENQEMCRKGKDFIYEALDAGWMAPRIDRVYPMESYRDAWEYLRAPRKDHGKVVVQTGLT